MKTLNSILLAGALVMGAGLGEAQAADILPVDLPPIYSEAPELAPVEIGNGWYLRGDVGYSLRSDINIFEDRRLTVPVSAYEGVSFDEDINTKWGAGGGIGYRFNDWLRGDVTGEWLGKGDASIGNTFLCDAFVKGEDANGNSIDIPVKAGCDAGASAELDVYAYMANAYADLGTVVGVTPYVGGGLGVANIRSQFEAGVDCNAPSRPEIGCRVSPDLIRYGQNVESDVLEHDDSTWQFAYSLMAGVGYSLNNELTLDVGYRYFAVPEYEAFGVKNEDGFDMHQVRGGIRYALW